MGIRNLLIFKKMTIGHINFNDMTINGKSMTPEQLEQAKILKEHFEEIFNDNEDENDNV